MGKKTIRISNIREDLYDANLDTEYREALANSLIILEYVSDSPLNLYLGTEEEKKELENLAEKINMAKNTIEEAYNDMKREITPKFTKNLSKIIETITDGKYNKVKFDSNEGLIIEKDNGEYINCNNLSIGTVDQLYLALRISSMQEISEEKMPIILDEAFAFFDNERLKNILLFLENNYKENQIIIFTCSNREKEILDKLNIEYNFINL